MRVVTAVFLTALLSLFGCTRSYQVVEVPQYGADLYPSSQTKSGITIAVDEIRAPARAERYFGSDLIKQGLFPVNVVISNYSRQRVTLKQSDILLYRGREIIDPVPIELVVASAKRQHGRIDSSAEEQVGKFFESSAFREAILMPNETYSGVVFFAPPPPKRGISGWFKTYSTYSGGGPKIRIGVTGMDGGERVLFGPFPVTLPED